MRRSSQLRLDYLDERSVCPWQRHASETASMSRPGLSITACLAEISDRLNEAAAVAKAALVCAEAGAEREAIRIAMDLDVPLSEANTLHAAACLIGRIDRAADTRGPGTLAD